MKKGPMLIVALLFIWLGCNDDDKAGCKDVKKMTLNPAVIETVLFRKDGDADYSCWPFVCDLNFKVIVFDSHGCDITVNQSNEVQAGYDYYYDNGTPPCNCWWYVDCVFRGGVRFDLGTLQGKGIVGAKLKWSNRGACAANLYVPDDPWGVFPLPSSNKVINPWPPNSSGPGEIEVGSDVRNWVKGNQPNHGWLFVGPDESFANWLWYDVASAEIGSGLEGIHKCTSAVKGFKLEVLYTD